MKIPKEIYIKGKLWRIEYKWGLKDKDLNCGLLNGLCDFESKTIYIRRELSVEEKPQVFLHELVHAIVEECHLHENGGIDGIVEEVLAEGIADTFMQLFTMRLKRVSK